MDLIKKSTQLEIEYKELSEGMGGFQGYASTFNNVDMQNDIIEPGAFAETIKATKKAKDGLPLLWQHNISQPVGKITSLMEDEKGLLIEGFFSSTEKGQESRQLLKEGIINKMSIGFQVEKARYDDKKGLRYIQGIKLYEVSLVTFPANEKATITSVKSEVELPSTKRDFEKWLRDHGFSRTISKEITSCGFKQRDAAFAHQGNQPPVRDALDDLSKALNALTQTIQRSTPVYGNRSY